MLLTFAFSARDFIKDVGSYAGFAAVVALALFALLLFAQAREIKRLREWGGQAHDRIGELERSVAAALDMARRAVARPAAPAPGPVQQARGPVARRPVGPAAGAPAAAAGAAPRVASTSAPVRPQLLPAAPSGVGGPALASATVLIPLPGAPAGSDVTDVPVRPATPAARPAVPAVAAAATAVGQRERVVADDASNGHYDDDPSTDFPAAPPRRATPASAPLAARPAAGGPPRRPAAPAGARPRPGGRPQPAAPLRAGAGSRAVPPPPEEGSHGRRRLTAVVLVLAALIVVGGGAFLLLGGDDEKPTVEVQTPADSGRPTRTTATRRAAARVTPAPDHADVRVAVLNGTGVTGLASTVMGELTARGFPAGAVGDASSPRPSTAVSYRGGAEAAAREVAKTLGLSDDVVTEIDTDTETAVCRVQSPCTAQVVVTVGDDRRPQ